ncbi:MAG: hypothetical protein K9M07_00395 [Simkaniaceae bacterium]|nr:hypothetical protein [Simkaniaceae bacterium]MCF7851682.1 hypothetical protein [Simkaniaceae bacterium]
MGFGITIDSSQIANAAKSAACVVGSAVVGHVASQVAILGWETLSIIGQAALTGGHIGGNAFLLSNIISLGGIALLTPIAAITLTNLALRYIHPEASSTVKNACHMATLLGSGKVLVLAFNIPAYINMIGA